MIAERGGRNAKNRVTIKYLNNLKNYNKFKKNIPSKIKNWNNFKSEMLIYNDVRRKGRGVTETKIEKLSTMGPYQSCFPLRRQKNLSTNVKKNVCL